MSYKKCLLFFLFTCLIMGGQAQTVRENSKLLNTLIDSLKNEPISRHSYHLAEEILRQSEQENSEEGKVFALQEKALYFNETGQYEKAITILQDLLEKGRATQDEAIELDAAMELGFAFGSLRMTTEALSYFEISEKIARKNEDWFNLVLNYNDRGTAYIEAKNWSDALKNLLKAKELAFEKEETANLSIINNNIGLVYIEMGRADLSIPFFKQLLREEQQAKDTINILSTMANLARGYAYNGNFAPAKIYYDSSLHYANQLQLQDDLVFAYLGISEMYELQKDYPKALTFHKKYHFTKDSFFNYQSQRQINALEQEFQKERREKQLLGKRKEVQQLQFGVVGLAAVLVIAFLLLLKKREQMKRQIELQRINEALAKSQLKNKELVEQQLTKTLQNQQSDLTNLALDIARKNKFSNELIDQLTQLQKSKPDELKATLRSTILFVNNNLRISEDLEQLQVNITQINHAFYQKLDERFANLSANDKYVLGLIRLNLSNKDIAVIKNISLSSAKKARYRLRQKLALTPEVDLVGFLRDI